MLFNRLSQSVPMQEGSSEPSLVDPYYGSVVSLLRFNEGDGLTSTLDEIGTNIWNMGGSAVLTSTTPYEGNSAIRFSSASEIILSDPSVLAIGTADFTFELFFKIESYAAGYIELLSIVGVDGNPGNGCSLRFGDSGFGNAIQFGLNMSSLNNIYSSQSNTKSTMGTAWHHVALVRESGQARAYLDGNLLTLTNNIFAGTPTTSFTAGESIDANNVYLRTTNNGDSILIDNVRLTKNVARYSGNFVPPSDYGVAGPNPAITLKLLNSSYFLSESVYRSDYKIYSIFRNPIHAIQNIEFSIHNEVERSSMDLIVGKTFSNYKNPFSLPDNYGQDEHISENVKQVSIRSIGHNYRGGAGVREYYIGADSISGQFLYQGNPTVAKVLIYDQDTMQLLGQDEGQNYNFKNLDASLTYMLVAYNAELPSLKPIIRQNIKLVQFDPSTVGSMVFWIDAVDIPQLDGSLVYQWNDKSGNSNHAVQSDPLLAPVYKTSEINGLPSVVFDGVSDRLESMSQIISGTTDRTIFGVFRSDGLGYNPTDSDPNAPDVFHYASPLLTLHGTDVRVSDPGTDYTISIEWGLRLRTKGNAHYFISTGELPSVITNRWSTSFDGPNTTGSKIRLNGIENPFLSTTSDAPINTGVSSKSYIGYTKNQGTTDPTDSNTLGSSFTGPIGEIIIFNRRLTDIETTQIESYLISKWGIDTYISPPSGFLAYYPMIYDFNDHGPNGYDSTVVSNVSFGKVQNPSNLDQISNVARFSGTDSYVDLTDFSLSGGNFTVSMIIDPATTSTNTRTMLLGKHGSLGENIFLFGYGYADNKFTVSINNVSNTLLDFGSVFDRQLLTLTVEESGSNSIATIYRNGQNIGSTAVTSKLGNTLGKPWTIGQDWDTNAGTGGRTDFFNGDINHLLIYNRVLVQDEINQCVQHANQFYKGSFGI